MSIDLELTKTIANIITINAQSQALKLGISVNEIYSPQDILDIAKLSNSSQINNQGLATIVDELAKNYTLSIKDSVNLNNENSDAAVFDSPFGHFDSAMDFEDADSNAVLDKLKIDKLKKETVSEIVARLKLIQTTDKGELGTIVDKVIVEFPGQAEEYKSGKVQILGFLVGQCMKQSKGQGNPKIFNELLVEKLV
jgi:Asp-tRNA(Asn)/Glu-tRNA(Gln) amidotransferase B subunit